MMRRSCRPILSVALPFLHPVTRVQVIDLRYSTRYSSVLMTKADGKQFHSEVFDRTPEPTRRHLWRASPGPHTFLERQAPAQ